MNLGAVARSQQQYHYVHGRFAGTLATLQGDTGLNVTNNKYYNFLEPTADASKVKHQIEAKSSSDLIRNYAIGIYLINDGYARQTCQGLNPGDVVNVGDLPADNCVPDGNKIY